MKLRNAAPTAATMFAALLLAGCATTQTSPSPQDPWEPMNRGTDRFNDALDRALLKPVATGYQRHVPRVVRTGIGNLLSHLAYPTVIVNSLLQGKLLDTVSGIGRFALNSTVGLGGLLDPATDAGLERHDEDFGQTLGRWGLPPGPYVVLPLLGPSTLRDSLGLVADGQTDLRVQLDLEPEERAALGVIGAVDARAALLATEQTLESAYDRYAFVRNAWLQRREYLVRDGDVPPEPLEPLDEDWEAEPGTDGATAAPGGG